MVASFAFFFFFFLFFFPFVPFFLFSLVILFPLSPKVKLASFHQADRNKQNNDLDYTTITIVTLAHEMADTFRTVLYTGKETKVSSGETIDPRRGKGQKVNSASESGCGAMQITPRRVFSGSHACDQSSPQFAHREITHLPLFSPLLRLLPLRFLDRQTPWMP